MPLPLYACTILLCLLFSTAAAGAGFWVGMKVLGAREFHPRYAIPAAALQVFITILAFLLVALGHEIIWGPFVFIVYITGVALIARRGGKLRGLRLTGAIAVGVVITGATNITLTMIMRRTICDSFVLTTASMIPALQKDDRIFVDHTLKPARWDIVGYRPALSPSSVYVSRIAGLPGEKIELRSGLLTVNGAIAQPATDVKNIRYSTRLFASPGGVPSCIGAEGSPVTLGPDEYFLLSDNTAAARDSRYMDPYTGHQAGAVPYAMIVGVARIRYMPWQRFACWR